MTRIAGLFGIAALAAAPLANAAIVDFSFFLNGAQEVPPVDTPATGTGTAALDTVTNLFSWDITYTDLTGGAFTVAHFHSGAFGVNGPVEVNIGPSKVSGVNRFTGSVDLDNLPAVLPADITALLAGNWYANIHSQFAPGGEIRGQVNPVPEPGTWALLAAGLGLLALTRRRITRA